MEQIFSNGFFDSVAASAAQCHSEDDCPSTSYMAANLMSRLFIEMSLDEYDRADEDTISDIYKEYGMSDVMSHSEVRFCWIAWQHEHPNVAFLHKSGTVYASPQSFKAHIHAADWRATAEHKPFEKVGVQHFGRLCGCHFRLPSLHTVFPQCCYCAYSRDCWIEGLVRHRFQGFKGQVSRWRASAAHRIACRSS